jgi:hypothetical protein
MNTNAHTRLVATIEATLRPITDDERSKFPTIESAHQFALVDSSDVIIAWVADFDEAISELNEYLESDLSCHVSEIKVHATPAIAHAAAQQDVAALGTLQLIRTQLDGHEWNADTCDRIAKLLREAGLPIADTDESGSDLSRFEFHGDERALLAWMINHCGNTMHPWALETNIAHFKTAYAIESIDAALATKDLLSKTGRRIALELRARLGE